jgi:DHA1 family inner membrane transport protein
MEPILRPIRPSTGRATAAPRRPTRRTWPSLLTLGATTFVVVTGEMLPTAVLPDLAEDLDVDVARAGLLVSIWAATVVIASFPLARLTARFDRRRVIAIALLTVSAATVVTAVADGFVVAATSRVVAAAATGLLWATVNAHAAGIVPEQRIGRATAVVLGGGMLGTVVSVPAAHALTGVWGWRATFVALAVLGGLAAAAVLGVLVPARSDGSAGASGAEPRRRLSPVLLLGALGGVLLAAHFMAFTFVTALLSGPDQTVSVSALLLVFGVASLLGIAAVGRAVDRFPRATVIAVAALLSTGLAGLVLVGSHQSVDLLVVAAWGAASGAVGPAVQTRMLRMAGARHRDTAATLVPIVFNLGIAVGAAFGSAAVDLTSVTALPGAATVVALVATVGLTFAGRGRGRRRPTSRDVPAPRPLVECAC